MSILNRGHSIDASYQASVHMAEGFQRRRLKCEKLTDDGCQVMAKAHLACTYFRWQLLWEGNPEKCSDKPRIFSPPLREPQFKTR
jgi:hypothetical protein